MVSDEFKNFIKTILKSKNIVLEIRLNLNMSFESSQPLNQYLILYWGGSKFIYINLIYLYII